MAGNSHDADREYRDGYEHGTRLAGDLVLLTFKSRSDDFDRGVQQALEDVFMDRDEEDL